jgi:hypothetical protein
VPIGSGSAYRDWKFPLRHVYMTQIRCCNDLVDPALWMISESMNGLQSPFVEGKSAKGLDEIDVARAQ